MEKIIYNFGTSFVNNYVYFHNDKMILIDTGYENDYDHFKKMMEKAGFTLLMIDYVFITHSHSDHVGFLKRLLEVNKKALIISSLEAKERMKTGQNQKAFYVGFLSSFLGKLNKSRISYPSIDDDKRFIPYTEQNKELLKDMLGGDIIETTGHTKDSLSLLLTDKKCL
ncbi:MAG: MBL fold metallo-hydrolase [Bacillales bacterium]|nr:MBL fold metallo-hydrolase [Bacillales bacterium]